LQKIFSSKASKLNLIDVIL